MIRTFAIAASASALLAASPALLALEAHDDLEAELASGYAVEIEAEGVTARAQMPCDAAVSNDEGVQSTVCFEGDVMYIFASSTNVPVEHPSALTSDFDVAYAEIEKSRDTTSIEEFMVDGRRSLLAEGGPSGRFGVMRAIQLADDGVTYAIAFIAPDGGPASESTQQEMRNFAASLEIVE